MSDYFKPFSGKTAWFSNSVQPNTIKQWNMFGGQFSDKYSADYLFSDSQLDPDTINIYDTQLNVTVFKSTWIVDVVNCYNIKDISLGDYILIPIDSNTTVTSPKIDWSLKDIVHIDELELIDTRFIDIVDLPNLVIKKKEMN